MSANTFSSASKSNRTLQSLRYTMAATDNTEAFTSVLDLSAADIYSQQNYLPKTALPYSGSSQHLDFITATINDADANIAQYYFRVTMSRSDVTIDNNKAEAWLAISGSGYDPVSINSGGGVNTQNISPLQLTDWISNKYITASEAGFKSEGDPPGYNIQLYIDGVSTTAGFQFDYKTGVLQFVDNSVAPSKTSLVAVSGYRYVGQTLESFVSSSGGGSGVGFPFSGSAVITGSLLISGSNNEPVDLIVSGGLSVSEGIVASTGSISDFTATKLTSVSASIDHLTVNVLISGSTIVTSGSNTFGDGMEDTQTLIGTTRITGSAEITGSLNVSGSLQIQGIADVSASIAGAVAGGGIFDQQGSTDVYLTSKQLLISSSDPLMATPYSGSNPTVSNDGTDGTATKYAVVSSQSGWFYNHNVGVPKSKAWGTDLDGSYFNNFNHNTDASEILRFIAGLLKDQAPDVQPNTRTFASIVVSSTNRTGVTAKLPGYIPNGTTGNTTYTYLNGKGFATPGERLFEGISPIYSNTGGYVIDGFNSQKGGSTTITSSDTNGTQLFGLGDIGTNFAVSSSTTYKFADDSAKTNINSDTYSTLRIKSTGSTLPAVSEFTYNIIPTGNDLINPKFQDGLFLGLFSQSIIDPIGETGFATSLALNQATGYYQLTSSFQVQIGTALQTATSDQELFYADLPTINNTFNVSGQTISFSGLTLAAKTATSRSLGRTPFLKTATYSVGSTLSNAFDPLYLGTSTVANITSDGITGTPTSAASHQKSISFSSGDLVENNVLVPNGAGIGSSRSAGSHPTVDDQIILSASIGITPSNTQDNIIQTGFSSDTSFSATTTGTKSNSLTNTNERSIDYFTAGTFDQSVGNGVMAYMGGSESDGVGSDAASNEDFRTDLYRKEVSDTLLPSGTPTAYNVGNVFDVSALAGLDLQVKPGFLVKPGGSYKYWIQSANTGISNTDYRFYARTFSYGGSDTIKSLTITFNSGITLDVASASPWVNPASNAISVLIFNRTQSSTPYKFIDIADYTNSGNPGNQNTTGVFTNPFGSTINVLSNNNTTTGVPSAPSYKVQTDTAKFNDLTSSNPDWGMLIRYSGDPTPLQSISVTYSTS